MLYEWCRERARQTNRRRRGHTDVREKEVFAQNGRTGVTFESQIVAKIKRVKEAWRMLKIKRKKRGENRHNGARVRRRHSLPGSLSSHSRPFCSEATRRAATLPILFSWLDALQCAARALRNRLLILRLPSERAKPRRRS